MTAQQTSNVGESQLGALLARDRVITTPVPFPDVVEVAIIGGGIVGCAAAYFLARRGVRVAVFEKGRLAGEQSGRNWGWVRQQGRAAAELPMMMRSNALWRQWVDDLGEDTGFTTGGCFYLARTGDELAAHATWLAVADAHGLDTRLVQGRELSALLPGAADRWAGALYTPGDGRAEPGRAVPAIARAAARHGAIIAEHCAVRGIETRGGRVSAVITEAGTVCAGTVICAAGAWTGLFAGSLDITVPQLKIKGTVARTAPATEITSGTAWAPDVAIRRRRDGGYTVAPGSALEHAVVPDSFRFARRFLPALRQEHDAIRLRLNGDFVREFRQPRRWPLDRETVFERTRVLHPEPSRSDLAALRVALARDFPEIADAPFVETWAGMIETSPDKIPIISTVESLPGFVVATGFSGHGFGLGPGAGEAIAKLVTGDLAAGELDAFRLQRYFDGSKIELGPTV